MKTVKDVSVITGISVRTLRYYDEIGLLKPTKLTDAGYRMYDGKALERLQEIMFFRELEVPLVEIKKIMDNADYDKEQILRTQKALLEQKRNRLNGIIDDQVKEFGSIKKYREHLSGVFSNELATSQVIKWYGGKEKAVESVIQATGDKDQLKQEQDETAKVYKQSTSKTENWRRLRTSNMGQDVRSILLMS